MAKLTRKLIGNKLFVKGLLTSFNTPAEARKYLKESKLSGSFYYRIEKENNRYVVWLSQKYPKRKRRQDK